MKSCDNCFKKIICSECRRKLCKINERICIIEGHYCFNGSICIECYEKKDKK